MPFDVVAFYQNEAKATLMGVSAVADDVYTTSGDDIIVKKRAPYLGGLCQLEDNSQTFLYGEIRQPSLKVPYRSNLSGTYLADCCDSALLNLLSSPLPLYAGEKMNSYVLNATAIADMVFAWLVSGRAPLASIEAVNPTHMITGAGTQALTAGSFTTCAITWDQDLPKGKYAVVGMAVNTYKSSGYGRGIARLKLVDTTWRPGVLTTIAWGDALGFWGTYGMGNKAAGRRWPLMPEISFEHDQMPDIEICAAAAETKENVNLLLQKIA